MSQLGQSIANEGKHLMDRLPAVPDSVRETMGTLQTYARDADARTRAFVQERPLVALGAALAVGFVLRRLLTFGR